MNFDIKETFTCGKAISGYTEDRIVQSAHHFGILDGSRGPMVQDSDVITLTLDRAVAFLQALEPEALLQDVVDGLTALVAGVKNAAGFDDFRRTGGFVFCLYSKHFNEIWRVGDCQFHNGGVANSNFWTTEGTCAEMRSMIIHSMLADGMTSKDVMALPTYHELIDTLLKHQSNFLNRGGDKRGFGAIIGIAPPKEYIERYVASSGSLSITSDGYPGVFESLDEAEDFLAKSLKEDPMCISQNVQCKGFSSDRMSFDDRAFIRAVLS